MFRPLYTIAGKRVIVLLSSWKNAFNCSMGPCFEFIAPSQSKLPLLLRNTSDQTAGFHAWRLLRHDQS